MSYRFLARSALMVLGLVAGTGIAAGQGFRGAYQLDQWTTTGIADGVTWIDSGDALVFSYDVDLGNPGNGVPFETAEFSAIAPASGSFTVDWDYSGFHAFCCPATAVLQLFAETSNGRVVVDLVAPFTSVGGDFDFSGQDASIQIEAGMPFGIIVGGGNFDSDSRLNGTVRLTNARIVTPDFQDAFDPPNWSDTGIEDGTTLISPSAGPSPTLDYSYDVDLSNPGFGVPSRVGTIGVTVPRTGTISFDWDYSGFHAFFAARATLLVTVQNGSNETTFPLVGPNQPVSGNFQLTGTTSVPVHAGDTLSITAGGRNIDSDSRLMGTVSLSNFAYEQTGFVGTMARPQWSSTGILAGTTVIGSGLDEPATTGLFAYDVNLGNPGPGVSPRTTTFSAIAEADGVVSFDWLYQGFHAFCCPAEAVLQLFAETSAGVVTVDLVPLGTAAEGGYSFSGTNASIAVEAGMPFGIIVGGSNNDSNSVLRGTVTLTNFSAPIAGDLDGDGDVDLTDLSSMLGAFGTCDGDTGFVPAADIDNSGCVDLTDLSGLLGNFGV